MYVWIIYDISRNRTRNIISKLCKQIGLERVQKSAFLGKPKLYHLKEFRKIAKGILNPQTDVLFIIPATKRSLKATKSIGRSKTIKRILKKRKVVFME